MHLQASDSKGQLPAEVARPQEPPALGEKARVRSRSASSVSKEFAIVGTTAISSTTSSLLPLLQEVQVLRAAEGERKRSTRKRRRKAAN